MRSTRQRVSAIQSISLLRGRVPIRTRQQLLVAEARDHGAGRAGAAEDEL